AFPDRGEVGAALDAAGGVEIERARLVPVDADRTEHVVERPALRGPAPHLGFACGGFGHHVLFPDSLAAVPTCAELKFVMAGLDPAIHDALPPLETLHGPPGQAPGVTAEFDVSRVGML